MHRPQAGALLGGIGRKNRAGGLDRRILGQGIVRGEKAHQRSRPLPTANRQLMMGGAPVLGDPAIVYPMLVLFRMPDDHDLVHDQRQNPLPSGMRAVDASAATGPARPVAGQCLHIEPGSDNMTVWAKWGSQLGRLWTRRVCLLGALALATPAAAAPPPLHRIVAVGDLHGDFAAWRDIARAARLVDGNGGWIGGDAVLVQTGDAVDRGQDSLKIVQDLMRLQREASRSKGQVVALVGNHEAMNVTGDFRYVSAGDYAAYVDSRSVQRRENVYESNKQLIEAFYHQRDPTMSGDAMKQAWLQATPLGSIEHRVAWGPNGSIGRWVAGNPAVAMLDGNIFVHGGISPAYTHRTIDEINRQVQAALLAGTTDPHSIINDSQGPLWYRGLAVSDTDAAKGAQDATPPVEEQVQSVLSAFGAKRIVIGHTPLLSGISLSYDGWLARIDTGISSVYGGKVSYLEILDGNPIPHIVERSQAPPK